MTISQQLNFCWCPCLQAGKFTGVHILELDIKVIPVWGRSVITSCYRDLTISFFKNLISNFAECSMLEVEYCSHSIVHLYLTMKQCTVATSDKVDHFPPVSFKCTSPSYTQWKKNYQFSPINYRMVSHSMNSRPMLSLLWWPFFRKLRPSND